MALPAQAQFMVDEFGGDFVLKTFVNNNVDNTWMFRSGDVVLLVDEEWDRITVQLGGSSHATRQTGKVKSSSETLRFTRPSKNVGEINDAKADVLAKVFGGHSDLYTAWVSEFGESSIRQDER